jgi:hypothetical protein
MGSLPAGFFVALQTVKVVVFLIMAGGSLSLCVRVGLIFGSASIVSLRLLEEKVYVNVL